MASRIHPLRRLLVYNERAYAPVFQRIVRGGAVDAVDDTLRTSTVVAAVLSLMIMATCGMVGWLLVRTVAYGETLQHLSDRQDWVETRLTDIERRLTGLEKH